MNSKNIEFSIIILTYNRPDHLTHNLNGLLGLVNENIEIIVVDNCSENINWAAFKVDYPTVKFIHLKENKGVYGRNVGIEASNGKYVVTLDDDVSGLSLSDLGKIDDFFNNNPDAGALCFKVLDALTKGIVNWIHHCKPEEYAGKVFSTYEITEGAVAFKKEVLNETGLYPANFFISHEGPDLAYRIINKGYKVYYSPNITVLHAHAVEGRANWRRYYFDTRNSIWLAARNYNLKMLLSRLPIALTMMLIYSIRDGYLKYWFRGVFHGLKGIKTELLERIILNERAKKEIKLIDQRRPPLSYMIKKRILNKKIRI